MVTKKELKQAIRSEIREHGNGRLARKLVKDHLKKDPSYYSKSKGTLKGSSGLLSNKTGLLSNKY